MSSFLVMSKDDTAVLRAKRAKQSMEVKEAKYYHLYDCCVIYRRFCLYMWVPALCSLLEMLLPHFVCH